MEREQKSRIVLNEQEINRIIRERLYDTEIIDIFYDADPITKATNTPYMVKNQLLDIDLIPTNKGYSIEGVDITTYESTLEELDNNPKY